MEDAFVIFSDIAVYVLIAARLKYDGISSQIHKKAWRILINFSSDILEVIRLEFHFFVTMDSREANSVAVIQIRIERVFWNFTSDTLQPRGWPRL